MNMQCGKRHIAARVWQTSAFLAVILVLACLQVVAQTSVGTILGVVKDSSGAVVPGATVTIQNVETSETRTATTGDDGSYRVPALAVGHYSVKIEKSGFQTQTQQNLVLNVTQELVANATLQVGSSAQEVVVTSEAPLVNTTTSTLGGLVDEQRIASLPLNGRNYIDLSLLQAGVTRKTNSSGAPGTGGTWFSADGAPAHANLIAIDGAVMNNQFWGNSASLGGTTLGVDGIREYRVITNGYDAEYGQSMGGQMVLVSKGGSNQWHGDAFEYLRNSALDARNYFDSTNPVLTQGHRLPEFQRNNYGGSF